MCLWEFITKETLENKRWFCECQCPISNFNCCGISDRNIDVLKSEIDLEITKLKLIKEMIER